MLTTLYLTAEEKELFSQLSDELKEGWDIEEETGKAYETPQALRMRMQMASFDDYPAVVELVESLKAGEDIESVDLSGLDQGVLSELCFTIGARGMSALLMAILQGAETDQDIEGIAGLSLLRHEMLDVNAQTALSSIS